MAKELGQYGIAVNAVCPGFISTDMNNKNVMKAINAEKQSLLCINKAKEELVAFIVFMTSDLFSSVSGRVFNIDSRLN